MATAYKKGNKIYLPGMIHIPGKIRIVHCAWITPNPTLKKLKE